MKVLFSTDRVSENSVLVACSSHEERCMGVSGHLPRWHPQCVALFHSAEPDPEREGNHKQMLDRVTASNVPSHELPYSNSDPTTSLRNSIPLLRDVFEQHRSASIVLDISVIPRQHLLMLCQWMTDARYWNRLIIVYSEPSNYDVSKYMPLSFGLSSLQQIPGLLPCTDLSRPIHLILFLGCEGDRAMAIYDRVKPHRTTLIVPDASYRQNLAGFTRHFNSNLIKLVGSQHVHCVESIDPDIVAHRLQSIVDTLGPRSEMATIVAPLGTKPQALGTFLFSRSRRDRPAIIYACPLRYTNRFYAQGVGSTWIIKDADR